MMGHCTRHLKGFRSLLHQRFKFQQQQHAESKNCLSSSCCYLNFGNSPVTVAWNVSSNFFLQHFFIILCVKVSYSTFSIGISPGQTKWRACIHFFLLICYLLDYLSDRPSCKRVSTTARENDTNNIIQCVFHSLWTLSSLLDTVPCVHSQFTWILSINRQTFL